MLRFYAPRPKEELVALWARQKVLLRGEVPVDLGLAEDERVEDAGLDFDETAQMAPVLVGQTVTGKFRVSA